MQVLKNDYLKTLNQNELLYIFFNNVDSYFNLNYTLEANGKMKPINEIEYNNLLENIEILRDRINKLRNGKRNFVFKIK